MKIALALTLAAAALAGCRSSDRDILLADSELQVQPAVQLPAGTIPIAVNREGTRLALVRQINAREDAAELLVIDVDTQETLGHVELTSASGTTPVFSLDGLTLRYDAGSKKMVNNVDWDFAAGTSTPVGYEPHSVPLLRSFASSGWNYDRTIGILYPSNESGNRKDGQIGLAEAAPVTIPFGETAGFDQFGNAWFGVGNAWTMVDRSGKQTRASASPFLVADQTTDRGSMHLRMTEQEMRFQGASAFVGSVWLSHDRAIRSNQGRRASAALVYAGADVLTYGFVPGRDMVYVVTATGSFLIPWKFGPGESGP